ncbi:hypothetical protein BRADO4318 [Bradyrhizobium sp. ORS 278]|nr:hypothetical protein BRADO4318 [Bradyrhizobium sp. ORS 278]
MHNVAAIHKSQRFGNLRRAPSSHAGYHPISPQRLFPTQTAKAVTIGRHEVAISFGCPAFARFVMRNLQKPT